MTGDRAFQSAKTFWPRARRWALGVGLAAATAVITIIGLGGIDAAQAQSFSFDLGEDGGDATARIVQVLTLITVLSLAPSILIMVTSFIRIVVVLSFLRVAMGTQQTPPNQVLISLAIFLTVFIMAPTFQQAWDQGIQPIINDEVDEFEGFQRATVPFRDFMMRHVREEDLGLFVDVAGISDEEFRETLPMRVIIPAYMIGELRRAFEIGFLLFVPFLIIDMTVASVLMSMGMMMLPPIIIALPFKIIFFVLVDGWFMTVGSLVRSFSSTAGGG